MTTTKLETTNGLTEDEATVCRHLTHTKFANLDSARQELKAWFGNGWFVYQGGSHVSVHRFDKGPRILFVTDAAA